MVKFLKSKWLLMVMIPLIGWLSLSFIKIKLQENIVNKEVANLEAKINNIKEENSSLEKVLGYLANPSFLQKEARIKINYKSPDEGVAFVYTDEDPGFSSGSVDINERLSRLPNPAKWIYYLMGY